MVYTQNTTVGSSCKNALKCMFQGAKGNSTKMSRWQKFPAALTAGVFAGVKTSAAISAICVAGSAWPVVAAIVAFSVAALGVLYIIQKCEENQEKGRSPNLSLQQK